MRALALSAILLSLLIGLGGCGHKGPLKLPEPAPTQTGSAPDNTEA